jgi:hypothetical protein
MLRTHEYEFKPGKTSVRKDASTGGARTRVFSRQIIVSALGAGTLVVRDIGADHPDSPHEFRLPYGPGTYTLDLAFAWPDSGYEVVNEAIPDASGCKYPVRIALVRSDDSTEPEATRYTVADGAGRILTFGAAASPADETSVCYVKCSTEASEPFAYAVQATAPTFATSPKLYPGEALPPLEVRRGLTLALVCDAGLTSIAEVIRVKR